MICWGNTLKIGLLSEKENYNLQLLIKYNMLRSYQRLKLSSFKRIGFQNITFLLSVSQHKLREQCRLNFSTPRKSFLCHHINHRLSFKPQFRDWALRRDSQHGFIEINTFNIRLAWRSQPKWVLIFEIFENNSSFRIDTIYKFTEWFSKFERNCCQETYS